MDGNMTVPPTIKEHRRILLFDGVCNLCSAWVRFIYRHDHQGLISFAPVQSSTGDQILEWAGFPSRMPEMMVYVEDQQVFVRSDAFLMIIARFGFPWNLLRAGWVVPRPVRDWIYDRVAALRYQIFGKMEQCMIPPSDLKQRFVDQGGEG